MASMLTELDRALSRSCSISETASNLARDAIHHKNTVRASCASREAENGHPCAPCRIREGLIEGNTALPCTCARRMVAVAVALSEPADASPIDWPATIAANLRLLYGHTSVEIIDTWSPSEGTQLGSLRPTGEERVDQ